MSLKQVSSNRNGIHNYEYKMKQVFSQIERELSPENVKLITKYNQAMTNLSIAIATRQKHLRTLLNLTKFVGKNWSDVTETWA
ncbi:MAG: hypothetical protein COY74_01315 [Nitrosopumilales archaeon CG_4_10_14_0_8_um_filter_34_8]|nr:MAG: hypothetical protein COY74_01315 [Nitrosopumilales archaeon CG_4_10_14_0_8_um_filter_34_8]